MFQCNHVSKQGVAITGRNTTGPPRSVGRPIARRPRYSKRRQTPTNTSEQNNTGPLGGPVMIMYRCTIIKWC